jgi:ABC-type multidrug transport system ATPase subunit
MNLEIRQLNKTYANGVQALKDVNLDILPGMFGLLGPNGAGKSTLMKILATLLEADSGAVTLNGTNVLSDKQEVRKILGYLPQEFGVYPRISAYGMLDHLSILKGVANSAERKELVEGLLHHVNLYEHRKKRLDSFSGGMKQRFGIAQALIGNPRLIIVDEPTAGLDPGERNRFYNLLADIGEEVIVILSTHIVQDVKELCTHMAIIDKGELLFSGAPNDALEEISGKVWEKSITKEDLTSYKTNHKILSSKLVGGQPIIHVYDKQNPGDEFSPAETTLEDVFFSKIFRIKD